MSWKTFRNVRKFVSLADKFTSNLAGDRIGPIFCEIMLNPFHRRRLSVNVESIKCWMSNRLIQSTLLICLLIDEACAATPAHHRKTNDKTNQMSLLSRYSFMLLTMFVMSIVFGLMAAFVLRRKLRDYRQSYASIEPQDRPEVISVATKPKVTSSSDSDSLSLADFNDLSPTESGEKKNIRPVKRPATSEAPVKDQEPDGSTNAGRPSTENELANRQDADNQSLASMETFEMQTIDANLKLRTGFDRQTTTSVAQDSIDSSFSGNIWNDDSFMPSTTVTSSMSSLAADHRSSNPSPVKSK